MLFFVSKKMKTKRANRLSDKRLLERGAQFMSRIVEKRSCVIRQISTSWKEEMGFWRYLKNKKVSVQWLLEQSLVAMKSEQDFVGRHILSIQDSSTIGFKVAKSRKKGLDYVGSSGSCPGFIIHPNLLIDADDGRCLGLGDLAIFDEWVSKGDKYSQKHVSAEEKKSVRWLDSGKATRPLLQTAQTITHIADRESDFYEMLVEFGQNRQENEHLLVRVSDDRLCGTYSKIESYA